MGYSDLGNRYRNPILFADYSDPDVIRVGDTYYMTASSFNYTPGLPILVSKDLVNWELKAYALKNIGQDRYKIPRHSEGVWAPSIRYHEGMFYIYYGMPDEGYYVVRTKDPLGEWEEPVCVLEGKGLIDPCPFWDDNGKAYVIHGYAKSRIGFKSILGIFEMSTDGLKAISEDHFIFNGNDPSHPAVTIEGPKVYKRNGYYYIWAPAGGVKEGYQVVLRSRDIYGPYEIRKVMDTGNTVINGPHQGGLVDTVNGDEWFIHFQDRGLYGRICHLQPVKWEEDWPVVGVDNEGSGCGKPVYEYDKPNCAERDGNITNTDGVSNGENTLEPGLLASDDFKHGNIGQCWQWMGDHSEEFYGTIRNGGGENASVYHESDSEVGICNEQHEKDGLRLFCLNPSGDEKPIIWRSANVLTQKIIYPVFEATCSVDVSGLMEGERAGVVMTGGQYLTTYVEKSAGEYFICVAESEGSDADKKEVVKRKIAVNELLKNAHNDENGHSDENGHNDENAHYDECNHNEETTLILDESIIRNISFKITFSYKGKSFDSTELYFQHVNRPMFGENPSLAIEVGLNNEYYDLGVDYTPSDHTWVGAKLGIYALSGGRDDEHGFADFLNFHVKEL